MCNRWNIVRGSRWCRAIQTRIHLTQSSLLQRKLCQVIAHVHKIAVFVTPTDLYSYTVMPFMCQLASTSALGHWDHSKHVLLNRMMCLSTQTQGKLTWNTSEQCSFFFARKRFTINLSKVWDDDCNSDPQPRRTRPSSIEQSHQLTESCHWLKEKLNSFCLHYVKKHLNNSKSFILYFAPIFSTRTQD